MSRRIFTTFLEKFEFLFDSFRKLSKQFVILPNQARHLLKSLSAFQGFVGKGQDIVRGRRLLKKETPAGV